MPGRGTDVLLPTTQVGSYPRPLFMAGKVFSDGTDAPEFASFRMRELYRDAVSLVVKDQLDAGLDVVTDGGQHYENETGYELSELVHYLPMHFEGYVPYGERLTLGAIDIPLYKPTVSGPVGWKRPIFKPILEALKDATTGPAKINIGVGPVTMALLSTDQHYGGDIPALAMDLAAAYNAEMKDLATRGLEQVQLAEPLNMLFAFLEPAPWIADVINRAFDGVPMYRVIHMCYAHQEGQSAMTDNMFHKVFPWAFDIDADQFHIEAASHSFAEIADLKSWSSEKDLGFGVIDVKQTRFEQPEAIASALRELLTVVPAENVCVSTDCSMASFRRNVARKKLAALAEGARIVRAEVTGSGV